MDGSTPGTPAGDAIGNWPRFRPVGDLGLLVEFGNAIDPALNDAVVALDRALAAMSLPGVVETVPTYRSLLIEYEPRDISLEHLVERVRGLLRRGAAAAGGWAAPTRAAARRLLVPAAYGGELGDDLAEVARLLGADPEALIDAHLAAEYRVYMIGFMPGFAYLGGLPSALHLPRRRTPRARAPGGSVMIGGMQAAIAALPLPTGWHVIGRTPARGFDKGRAEPFLFRAGDRVRFRRISAAEFARLSAIAAEGARVAEVIR